MKNINIKIKPSEKDLLRIIAESAQERNVTADIKNSIIVMDLLKQLYNKKDSSEILFIIKNRLEESNHEY
ncbi:MAG: hypothetical protein ACRDCC_08500 [Culicoidibacterales bacterium]